MHGSGLTEAKKLQPNLHIIFATGAQIFISIEREQTQSLFCANGDLKQRYCPGSKKRPGAHIQGLRNWEHANAGVVSKGDLCLRKTSCQIISIPLGRHVGDGPGGNVSGGGSLAA